jgi:hypothetical protein
LAITSLFPARPLPRAGVKNLSFFAAGLNNGKPLFLDLFPLYNYSNGEGARTMYERMLDKEKRPTRGEMEKTMGVAAGRLWSRLETFLKKSYDLRTEVRFPFGNNYGWGLKYSHRSKHLFYLFPESGSFTVMIQIGGPEVEGLGKLLPALLPKTRDLWDKRYPCGAGGWIHYRVFSARELDDVIELVKLKKKPAAADS